MKKDGASTSNGLFPGSLPGTHCCSVRERDKKERGPIKKEKRQLVTVQVGPAPEPVVVGQTLNWAHGCNGDVLMNNQPDHEIRADRWLTLRIDHGLYTRLS